MTALSRRMYAERDFKELEEIRGRAHIFFADEPIYSSVSTEAVFSLYSCVLTSTALSSKTIVNGLW
uniref:Uncharacterized protein n=1 Tax=Parascaris equorum TaxID=6256 RepID=A0A914S0R4_PAREQ